MFKSLTPVRTIKKSSVSRLNKNKRVRDCYIPFRDINGDKILTIFGKGDLKRRKGNDYSAVLYKITTDRYAVRIWDSSQAGIATYVGNATTPGSKDAIINLHAAIAGSPFIRSVFHNETLSTVSASLLFADGTAFSHGRG